MAISTDAKFVIGLLLLIALILGGGCALTAAQCQNVETLSGRPTEWHVMGGCFVEVDGEVIPIDNWRELD